MQASTATYSTIHRGVIELSLVRPGSRCSRPWQAADKVYVVAVSFRGHNQLTSTQTIIFRQALTRISPPYRVTTIGERAHTRRRQGIIRHQHFHGAGTRPASMKIQPKEIVGRSECVDCKEDWLDILANVDLPLRRGSPDQAYGERALMVAKLQEIHRWEMCPKGSRMPYEEVSTGGRWEDWQVEEKHMPKPNKDGSMYGQPYVAPRHANSNSERFVDKMVEREAKHMVAYNPVDRAAWFAAKDKGRTAKKATAPKNAGKNAPAKIRTNARDDKSSDEGMDPRTKDVLGQATCTSAGLSSEVKSKRRKCMTVATVTAALATTCRGRATSWHPSSRRG